MNKYEQDRIEMLSNWEWYFYFANPELVENTLSANDELIKKEHGEILRQSQTKG